MINQATEIGPVNALLHRTLSCLEAWALYVSEHEKHELYPDSRQTIQNQGVQGASVYLFQPFVALNQCSRLSLKHKTGRLCIVPNVL